MFNPPALHDVLPNVLPACPTQCPTRLLYLPALPALPYPLALPDVSG